MTPEVQSRLRRVPEIRRARGYRLYAANGTRLIDLWQAGGRAILGHRGGGVITRVKAVLDRGVLVSLPSVAERRLTQALKRLLGELSPLEVAVYADETRAVTAVSTALGLSPEDCLPFEPVRAVLAPGSATGSSGVSRWRPFLPDRFWTPESLGGGVLLPVLPAGMLFGAQTVVYPAGRGIELVSDLIPEAALTALTAAADALATASNLATANPPTARSADVLPGFASAGPYLVPMAVLGDSSPSDYDEVFDRFLEAGVLISPDPAVPSIYPAELSDGERKTLLRAARESERRK